MTKYQDKDFEVWRKLLHLQLLCGQICADCNHGKKC